MWMESASVSPALIIWWMFGPEGSIAKLLWSEAEQHITEVASAVLGPDALSGPWARDRVYSRALTIAGGTTQVNKNIVAQRILGLPRGD